MASLQSNDRLRSTQPSMYNIQFDRAICPLITHLIDQTKETTDKRQQMMTHHDHRTMLLEEKRSYKIPSLKYHYNGINIVRLG